MAGKTVGIPKISLPKLKTNFREISMIIGVHLPMIVMSYPSVRARLLEIREEDPMIDQFVDSLEDIYKMVTT